MPRPSTSAVTKVEIDLLIDVLAKKSGLECKLPPEHLTGRFTDPVVRNAQEGLVVGVHELDVLSSTSAIYRLESALQHRCRLTANTLQH